MADGIQEVIGKFQDPNQRVRLKALDSIKMLFTHGIAFLNVSSLDFYLLQMILGLHSLGLTASRNCLKDLRIQMGM